MRAKVVILALAGLAAFGQSPSAPSASQVFPLTVVQDPQEFQDVVNTVRVITLARQVTVDMTARTLTVTGSPDQIAAATWLTPKLDQPPTPSGQKLTSAQYDVAGNDMIQVFSLSNTQSPQTQQEMLNVVRSIAEVQRAYACTPARVIVVRTTAEQAAAVDWILQVLDQTPALSTGSAPSALRVLSYPFPDLAGIRGNTALRVFYPSLGMAPQALQESINAIRVVAEVQRAVAVNAVQAIVLKTTPEMAALSEWILRELDQPAAASPAWHNYSVSFNGQVASVLHLVPVSTGQTAQQVASGIRSTTRMQRTSFCSLPRALAVRGTADQVAMAEKMMQPSVPAH